MGNLCIPETPEDQKNELGIYNFKKEVKQKDNLKSIPRVERDQICYRRINENLTNTECERKNSFKRKYKNGNVTVNIF